MGCLGEERARMRKWVSWRVAVRIRKWVAQSLKEISVEETSGNYFTKKKKKHTQKATLEAQFRMIFKVH